MTIKNTAALASLFCVTMLLGCHSDSDEEESDIRPRADVEVAAVSVGSIDNFVHATGSFQVLRDERVKSTIAGTIEKVLVLEGDAVRKRQTLVTILSQESHAAIAGAEQLISHATTDADRARAEAALRLAQKTAAIARISAPFDGAIVHRFVNEGDFVPQGSELVEIIDPNTEYFVADIPLSIVAAIRVGQPAVVAVPAMKMPVLRGSVQAINRATDPNSQTVQVRISLPAIPALVTAGTFGNVQIKIARHRDVLLVPRSAVYHDDELDRYEVWRVEGDSLALITRVFIGVSDSSQIEITSGLKAGDVVATTGGYGLPDSTRVTVTHGQHSAE